MHFGKGLKTAAAAAGSHPLVLSPRSLLSVLLARLFHVHSPKLQAPGPVWYHEHLPEATGPCEKGQRGVGASRQRGSQAGSRAGRWRGPCRGRNPDACCCGFSLGRSEPRRRPPAGEVPALQCELGDGQRGRGGHRRHHREEELRGLVAALQARVLRTLGEAVRKGRAPLWGRPAPPPSAPGGHREGPPGSPHWSERGAPMAPSHPRCVPHPGPR